MRASALASVAGDAARRAFSSIVKKNTGIVGLDVVPDARAVLLKLYEKTLGDIKVRPLRPPAGDVGARPPSHPTVLTHPDPADHPRARRIQERGGGVHEAAHGGCEGV